MPSSSLCVVGVVGWERAVDEIHTLLGARDGGIEPAIKIERGENVGHDASHVDKHVAPATPPCPAARPGIAHLHLQGVELGVLFDLAIATTLVAHELGHHAIV